ncbi:hypothetical protein [Mucilaginibacter sp. HD30]
MKKIQLTLLALTTIATTYAQKLPTVQQASVTAPSNIKIDGKANDWGNKFEANNSATELLYTIANDDKKLYLIAQTTSPIVMSRIANGGIKLLIQKNGTKTDAGAPFIKFPFLQKGKRVSIGFVNIIEDGKNGMRRAPEPKNAKEAERIADSLARNNNKKLMKEQKWVYTSGIAGVDTLLAIYNENGIQASNATNSKKAYTFELAIDLKLLGLQADNAEKFSYHIVINGEPNKSTSPFGPAVFAGDPALATQNEERIRRMNEQMEALYATTDFWGEYTLAK